jgi:hypothetical protein
MTLSGRTGTSARVVEYPPTPLFEPIPSPAGRGGKAGFSACVQKVHEYNTTVHGKRHTGESCGHRRVSWIDPPRREER